MPTPKTLSDQLSDLAEAIHGQRELLFDGPSPDQIQGVREVLDAIAGDLYALAEQAEGGGTDAIQTVVVHSARGDGSQTHYVIEGHHPPIEPLPPLTS